MKKQLLLGLAAAACSVSWAAIPAGYEWPTDMITAQPEGTEYQTYCGSQISWLLYNGTTPASTTDNYGIKRQMVVDGDNVYLRGFLLENDLDTWIKGVTQANGDVLFSFPQMISDAENQELYLAALTPTLTNGTVTLDFDPANCNMTMRWVDGVLTQVLPSTDGLSDEQLIRYTGVIGAVNKYGNFSAYGEKGMSVKKWSEEPATAPTFDSTENYAVSYVNADNQQNIAQYEVNMAGNQVWVKGLNRYLPDSWLHGTVTEAGNWEFNMAQYCGVFRSYYFFYLGMDKATKTQVDKITFTKQADGSLKADYSLALNIGTEKLTPSQIFSELTFTPMANVEHTPLAPTDLELEWDESDEMGVVAFLLPDTDTNGLPLDASRLYYNIYYDGELHTFTPEGDFVDEVMTDVPALYSNDLTIMPAGDGFIILAVLEPHNTVGVRCVYKNGNGTTTYSDILSGTLISGVKGVTATSEVVSEVYYDMQGRKIEKPANGMYIVKATYADGKTRAKVVLK